MKRKYQSDTVTAVSRHHPKSPYKLNPPNFAQLANLYPERFGKYVRWKSPKRDGETYKDVFVDFSDSKVAQALTSTLLLYDFNLKVEMPISDDLFLCPPVPNRVNYVCWISDLVNAHSRREDCVSGIKRVGDIGVGPIAIYPILGTTLFHMDFIGSDINVQAVEHAKKTIQRNNLEHNIGIFHVGGTDRYQSLLWERLLSPSMNDQKSAAVLQLKSFILDASGRINRGPLLMLLAQYCSTEVNACEERFLKTVGHNCNDEMVDNNLDHSPSPVLDAVMTNPPFYTLDEEIQVNTRTSCTGSNLEMRTPGGELAFIAAIIADSLVIRERVRWYTCMVGKKQSLHVLRNLLLREGIEANNIRTTVFEQGVTHRWGMAWSFVAEDNRCFADSHIWEKNVDLGSCEGVLDEISVSTRTISFKMLVSELLNTATDNEREAPDFNCDDVLQLAVGRVHSSLADTSTASVSAESKCCKVISFESITTSTSERLVKSTMSMGPLLFQLQLSTVLHTESENNLCCIDGDITCCFQAPSHSSMSSSSPSATVSTWIGSELTAESFADLTGKGKEHMQRIADLLQQNFLRSNRRWKRKLARLI